MKKLRIYAPIAAILLLAFACSKDSKQPVSAADTHTAMTSANQSLATDLSGVASAPGYVGLNSFASITNTNNPFARMTGYMPKDLSAQMKKGALGLSTMLRVATGAKKINGRVDDSTPFGFNDKKGVYTWNFDKQAFEKTGTSDIVEIDYPTEGSLTNDAVFKLKSYTETQFSDLSWNPTGISAEIDVDNTKQAEFNLTVTYDGNDTPNYVSLSIFINPYTFTILFDNTPTLTASASYNFSKSGTTLIEWAVSATFPDASKNTPSTVSGHLQLANIVFNYVIDGTKSSNDPNDYVVITVTVNGGAAGKVVFIADQNTGEEKPYIQYNDQTTESLETLFADAANQVQGLVP